MVLATAVGCAILVVDTALDFTLQQHLLDRPPPLVGTKYNRGMDHLALIVWPVLGYLTYRRDSKRAVLIGVPLAAAVAVTMSLAAKVAMMVGLLVLVITLRLSRLAAPLLAAGIVTIAVATPVGLHLLAEVRADAGLDPDPIGAYRRSGYQEKIVKERVGGEQAGWGA